MQAGDNVIISTTYLTFPDSMAYGFVLQGRSPVWDPMHASVVSYARGRIPKLEEHVTVAIENPYVCDPMTDPRVSPAQLRMALSGLSSAPVDGLKIDVDGLTDDDIPLLLSIQDLRMLRIRCGSLTARGLLALTAASNLNVLELIDARGISPYLNVLSGMPWLQGLTLVDADLSGMASSFLRSLLSLESLRLVGVDVDDELLRMLGRLVSLRRLHLVDSLQQESEILFLLGLTEVDDLAICGVGLRNDATNSIGNLSGLRSLELYACNLRDSSGADLSKLRHLTKLSLGQNAISDKSMQWISRLDILEHIDLHYTRITAEGVRNLSGHALFIRNFGCRVSQAFSLKR